MDALSVILVVALIVTNFGWLWFLRNHLNAERSERWQLQERIREPAAEHIPVGELIKSAEARPPKPKPADPVFVDDDKDEDELYAVGKINPDLPLRDKDDDGS